MMRRVRYCGRLPSRGSFEIATITGKEVINLIFIYFLKNGLGRCLRGMVQVVVLRCRRMDSPVPVSVTQQLCGICSSRFVLVEGVF